MMNQINYLLLQKLKQNIINLHERIHVMYGWAVRWRLSTHDGLILKPRIKRIQVIFDYMYGANSKNVQTEEMQLIVQRLSLSLIQESSQQLLKTPTLQKIDCANNLDQLTHWQTTATSKPLLSKIKHRIGFLRMKHQLVYKELPDILCDAFRPSTFDIMLAYHCGNNREHITTADGLNARIFKVIVDADQRGWLLELIKGAYAYNPTNQPLKRIHNDILALVSKHNLKSL